MKYNIQKHYYDSFSRRAKVFELPVVDFIRNYGGHHTHYIMMNYEGDREFKRANNFTLLSLTCRNEHKIIVMWREGWMHGGGNY